MKQYITSIKIQLRSPNGRTVEVVKSIGQGQEMKYKNQIGRLLTALGLDVEEVYLSVTDAPGGKIEPVDPPKKEPKKEPQVKEPDPDIPFVPRFDDVRKFFKNNGQNRPVEKPFSE